MKDGEIETPQEALGFLISFANGCSSTADMWKRIESCRNLLGPFVYPTEQSKADARALWAWRTLAQHHAHQGTPLHMYAVHAVTYEHNALAIARNVFPKLPEAVRRELGECPT